MTATELLAFISAALLLQLAAGIGWTVWRRRSAEASAPPVALAATSARTDAAWAGWRSFRVAQRAFEDAAQSQCSFYLQPVDGQALPPFKPGQFLTFALDVAPRSPHGAAGARAITRCYSLSDRPEPAHYRVAKRRRSGGRLHERGVVPWYRGFDRVLRLRRLHVLGRLAGCLPYRPACGRGTPPECR